MRQLYFQRALLLLMSVVVLLLLVILSAQSPDPELPKVRDGSCFVDEKNELATIPEYTFRGNDKQQTTVPQLISMMLSPSEHIIPSKMYSYLKDLLRFQHSTVPFNNKPHFETTLKEVFSLFQSHGAFNENEADGEVKKLLRTFFNALPATTLQSNYLDYSSPQRSDMPSDVVFVTTSYPLAQIYGPITLHLNNKDVRMINMWRWNMSHCNNITHFADVGEGFYPGYIKADALEGFDLRYEFPTMTRWRVRSQAPAKILVHFRK